MMTKPVAITILFAGLILTADSLASERCRRIDVDYARNCGDVVNINSLHSLDEPGDCAIIDVMAKSRWNASGIVFEEGATYEIEVIGNDTYWCDSRIVSDADGWHIVDNDVPDAPKTAGDCPVGKTGKSIPGPAVELTGLNRLLRFLEPFRRGRADSNWFELTGIESGGKPFPIGTRASHTANRDAEFCSFANDLSFMYNDNSGNLSVMVTRAPR